MPAAEGPTGGRGAIETINYLYVCVLYCILGCRHVRAQHQRFLC